MKLRPYQQSASDGTINAWNEGYNSALVVVPTGGGKTIIAADVVKRRREYGKILFIAHRRELIYQAKDKIGKYAGFKCEIEMGDQRASNGDLFGETDVVVASVQTLTAGGDGKGRKSKWAPTAFATLIIDEAHHAVGGSYQAVLDYFKFENPNLKILGITATPDRADEEALGKIFETVAYDYEMLDAINDGWLVPIEQQMVTVGGLDFSEVRTTAGDLNGADLAEIMENERNLQEIAGPTIEIIGNKKTIVFATSVKQAEMLSDIFNRYKSGCSEWVCGETEEGERRNIFSRFESSKTQILTNVGVTTEGYDNPNVEVIVMGRPTKSRCLFAQMAGRATRPLPGVVDPYDSATERKASIASSTKPSCLIVDFVGNSGKHKLMCTADILSGNMSDDAVARAILRAKASGKRMNMVEVMEEEAEKIRKEVEEREKRKRQEEARKMRLVAKASYRTTAIDPFKVFNVVPAKTRGWHEGKQLTEKQRNLLLKQGINPEGMPYAQSVQLIQELFKRWDGKLCTFKQSKLLQRFGYNPTNITMDEAAKIIDKIAANGWKRLEPVNQ